jgi:hypothetical protein
VITAIPSGLWFPESLDVAKEKYKDDITFFVELVKAAGSSTELLARIRAPSIPAKRRMSLLKTYRRCVSLVLDTETTSRITKITTQELISDLPPTFFKPIAKLKHEVNRPVSA